MRIVKLIIICIVVLMGVLTALSLIFPSHLRVQRSINIGPSGTRGLAEMKTGVAAAIGDLRSWDHWETFLRATPPEDRHYSAGASGKGASFRSGQLSLAITGAGPDSVHCHWELVSGKRFESGFYIYQMSEDSVTVQEWMDFHFRWYPWERLGILLYDKRLGPVMEESLTNLKRYVENSP